MNDPFGLLLERQVLDILDKIPRERFDAFKKELGIYVVVGSDADGGIMINWATVRSQTDERAVVLKVLDFLAKELALQITTQRPDEKVRQPGSRPITPDTVLHEKGVRHDPMLCEHCGHYRR